MTAAPALMQATPSSTISRAKTGIRGCSLRVQAPLSATSIQVCFAIFASRLELSLQRSSKTRLLRPAPTPASRVRKTNFLMKDLPHSADRFAQQFGLLQL